MAKYIDSGAFIEAVKDIPMWGSMAAMLADSISVADVAPVVRCKDCKWFADNNDGEWYGCQMFQVVRITPEDTPKPDDFCSYGERKDKGAENG